MPELEMSYWVFGIMGAIFVGLGKGGLPGVGNLTVALYAIVLPDPKLSVGVLLPILSASDIFAVWIYRKHGEWKYLKQLFPWAIVGVVVGYFSFQLLNANQVRILIGCFLLVFTMIHFSKIFIDQRKGTKTEIPDNIFFGGLMGILGGFSTMIANAAGPIASFYFMAMKLPKYAFIGTTAWFFLVINLIKIPFMVDLGIINWEWLPFSIAMMPFAIVATLIAPRIVKVINQNLFDKLIWFFIILAGIKLLIG